MKTIEYYAALANTDNTEGRGGTIQVAAFDNYSAALEFVKSDYYAMYHGVMGTPGGEHDVERKTFPLFATADGAVHAGEDAKRAELLNRLTAEEKRLLGIP